MKFRYHLGRALSWPVDSLLRARWFPLLRTFKTRENWFYDVCRFAGTRDFRTVIDVGANIGQTTLALHGYFPQAAIHSFEPVSSTFDQLQRNVARLRQVQTHRLAVGRNRGSVTIALQENSELNSLAFAVDPSATGGARAETVAVVSLDEFCAERAIDGIDILKTDAQGRDVEVIAGAARLAADGRIAFVYAEVTFQPGDITNTHFGALRDVLQPHGFELSGFYEQYGSGPRGRVLSFCNALFASPAGIARSFGPGSGKAAR